MLLCYYYILLYYGHFYRFILILYLKHFSHVIISSQVQNIHIMSHPNIADEHVEAAILFLDRFEHEHDLALFGQVTLVWDDFACCALTFYLFTQFLNLENFRILFLECSFWQIFCFELFDSLFESLPKFFPHVWRTL